MLTNKSVKCIFSIHILLLFLLLLHSLCMSADEIERFEYFDTDDGLSQNTITSIHCDSRGFLWIGTMNGLNRYDGYQFKIYQNTIGKPEIFTNNRVVSIWEDERQFLWFETYDGYYHYMNPRTESFSTLPNYQINLEEKYSRINYFYQHTAEELWLGSSNSGVYRLRYDSINDTYQSNQFLSRGQFAVSNNDVRFIVADRDSNLYIGTRNGLNVLKKENNREGNFYFGHFFPEMNFTSAVAFNNEVWLATSNSGIVVYNLDTRSYFVLNKDNTPLGSNKIDLLKLSSKGNVLIGTAGLFIYQPMAKHWLQATVDEERIDKLFEDSEGVLWVTTGKFGVKQVNQFSGESKHFDLTPPDYRYLSDKERPYFYEDKNKQLWICVHGGGLAQYQRDNDYFVFYRSDPSDPKSISSNTVMCMTEDQHGTLWVGAGLQGGLNRVIMRNPAFTSVQFSRNYEDDMENMVRAVLEDGNENLWVASKGGSIKIYNKELQLIQPALAYPFQPVGDLVYNVYTMMEDQHGHMWLGSKGAGIAVSEKPIREYSNYSKINFLRYRHDAGDTTSLCSDDIYSLAEDEQGNIWIGTYGGGVSVTRPYKLKALKFQTINTLNSNLSNDMVRDVAFDHHNNLWVATTFGLNKLTTGYLPQGSYSFERFFRDPQNPNSLSYNDVVHIFEDVNQQLWFGTFGGGVNRMRETGIFEHYSSIDGLINNDVFGITQDQQGYIWLSTENGLSRFDQLNETFENFNKSNSMATNNFSENTCLTTRDGRLVFGSAKGFEVIDPLKIKSRNLATTVAFTNFQLFNKDVDVHTPESPLKQSITYTDAIELKYNQSSFSIEFAAMNFIDQSKTQYAFFLENFDEDWNYVGNARKATYTNLKPGHYIFRVKSALWNGNWASDESQLSLTIMPPWWQTNFAYIVYLVVFVVATFLVSRVVIRINSFRNQLRIEKAVHELKLQFFTNLSHEIRTPLTLILGPIEDVLADRKFPVEYRSTLTLMQKNGQRMLHLLNQLLDFRKVQNKKMVLKVQPLDVIEFTRNIFDSFVPLARHKKIDFSFGHHQQAIEVWADPHRLDSVIFNILSNAFKFTPAEHAVSVVVEALTEKGEVHIKIADGGPGIRNKDIPLLFNRYTILSNNTANQTGTGIGLNLSYEIVRLHGGEIKVENVSGRGCEFTIVLKSGKKFFEENKHVIFADEPQEFPLMAKTWLDESQAVSSDAVKGQNKQPQGEKQVVLIVEDNLEILQYISDALSVDFLILTATNGREGLLQAQQYHPDLIISDVMMPGTDGIEMTRQLKDDFNTCHIPVILLTAKSGIDDQIQGIDSGAEAYVLKPFNMQLLHSMIMNLLEQRRLILAKYRHTGNVEVTDLKINSRNREFLDNIVAYIEENYNDPKLSISSLVEYSCVSRTVFYNKIKSLTGLSPIELMREVKLKIAAQMLENGYNVNETAFKIGFNDSRYFSKQFKEQYGESPSQYKKRHQTEQN